MALLLDTILRILGYRKVITFTNIQTYSVLGDANIVVEIGRVWQRVVISYP